MRPRRTPPQGIRPIGEKPSSSTKIAQATAIMPPIRSRGLAQVREALGDGADGGCPERAGQARRPGTRPSLRTRTTDRSRLSTSRGVSGRLGRVAAEDFLQQGAQLVTFVRIK